MNQWRDYRTALLDTNPQLGMSDQKLTLSADEFMHRLQLAYERGRRDQHEIQLASGDNSIIDFLKGLTL
jgi:hypothetical protein